MDVLPGQRTQIQIMCRFQPFKKCALETQLGKGKQGWWRRTSYRWDKWREVRTCGRQCSLQAYVTGGWRTEEVSLGGPAWCATGGLGAELTWQVCVLCAVQEPIKQLRTNFAQAYGACICRLGTRLARERRRSVNRRRRRAGAGRIVFRRPQEETTGQWKKIIFQQK